MPDKIIISDVPSILWKIEGVSSPFKFKTKPFQLYGAEMQLKIFHSRIPSTSAPISQILLKTQKGAINVLMAIEVGLVQHSSGSIDPRFVSSSRIDLSKFTEHIIWHKYDSDLDCDPRYGVPTFCDFFKRGYFFRVRISPDEWKPESIPASPAIRDDKSTLLFPSLGQDLSDLYDNPRFSDVTIECDDGEIRAHKAILAARSEFFDNMLRDDPREQPKDLSVSLKDVIPSVLRQVLRYIYTGDVPDLDSDNVQKVYEAAERFHLDALKLKCGNFMLKNSREKEASSAASTTTAAAAVPEEESESAILTYFRNINPLFGTKEWQQLCESEPEMARKTLELFVDESPL